MEMNCPRCGRQIAAGTHFCDQCGAPIPAPPAPKRKRRWLLPTLLLLLLLAAAAVFLLWFLGKQLPYSRAMDLYAEGDYARAESAFVSLEDYRDSEEMARACRYWQARDAYEKGDLALAAKQFAALGSFSDSAEWLRQCRLLALRGVWTLSGLWTDDLDLSAFLPFFNSTLVLREDGTGSLEEGGESAALTWDDVCFSDGSITYVFRLEKDRLILDHGSLTFLFTRA